MELLDLSRLGCHETLPGILDFQLLLPGVSPEKGFGLVVKVIHENDQFLQNVQPCSFPMAHGQYAPYGDIWSARVSLDDTAAGNGRSSWGSPGTYVYRYCLDWQENGEQRTLDWIIDPFAREFGTGKMSAITAGYTPYPWNESEMDWKVPALEDLVVYELMISEFGGSIGEAVRRLDYLSDLGITCIEVMPVTNTASTVDWGYMPTGYFGVDERFGNRADLQRFVDHAHQRGIAVILDMVYGHTDESFPYAYVYENIPGAGENPFLGRTAGSYVGRTTDFHKKFTQDFFYTANLFWLDRCHADGFRYDCVAEYYDGPVGDGYANLVYNTYRAVKMAASGGGYCGRFLDGGDFNLIQCAEEPGNPKEFLSRTCSNAAWQDATLTAAGAVARGGGAGWLAGLGLGLGLTCCPTAVPCGGDMIRKLAFQYTENHDHSRFLCNFGLTDDENILMREGKREFWYRVRPYLIGLMLGKGIPLLWQGQEFGENYWVPEPFTGRGRVHLFRPMRWDYFYTPEGKNLVWLVRDLVRMRRENARFRTGDHYFYNDEGKYQAGGAILFSREDRDAFSLVALNFGDTERSVPFAFPYSGDYRESLYGEAALPGIVAGMEVPVPIPANNGMVWTVKKR